MNGKQQAVFWLGLILVLLRLFTSNQWKEIWGTVLDSGKKKKSGIGGLLPPLFPLISNPGSSGTNQNPPNTIAI